MAALSSLEEERSGQELETSKAGRDALAEEQTSFNGARSAEKREANPPRGQRWLHEGRELDSRAGTTRLPPGEVPGFLEESA